MLIMEVDLVPYNVRDFALRLSKEVHMYTLLEKEGSFSVPPVEPIKVL